MASQVDIETMFLSDCIASVKLWKELIETHLDETEKENELIQMKEVVRDYCLLDTAARKGSVACQEVIAYCNSDGVENFVNIEELYKEKLAACTTNSDSHEEHSIWREVLTGIGSKEVEEVEPSRSQDVQDTDYEEMEDSIFYSNVFTPPIDPISKTLIENPYKNRVCGHIYEFKFIKQYIKTMKNKAKCPYIGCQNKGITFTDLVEDNNVKQKIEDYMKRSQTTVTDDE